MSPLANFLNKTELTELKRAFPNLKQRHYKVDVGRVHFTDMLKALQKQERRGEAVLVIVRPGGEVLLHTKEFYPAGVYRLPSGGVRTGEVAWAAARREMLEETGLLTRELQALGVLTYECQYEGRSVPFISYIFQAHVSDKEPQARGSTEKITGFMWVQPVALREVGAQLNALEGDWAGWGRFRALAHEFVAEVWEAAPAPQSAQ